MAENVFVLGLDAHNAAPPARPARRRPLPLPPAAVRRRAGRRGVGRPARAAGGRPAAGRGVRRAGARPHRVLGLPGQHDGPDPVRTARAALGHHRGGGEVRAQVLEPARAGEGDRRDPGFGLLDLDDPALPDGLGYPVWIKPIRSASSQLAFRADDPQQLTGAAATIRHGHPPHRRRVRHRARPAGPAARAGRRRRQRLPGRGVGHRTAGDGRGLRPPRRDPRLRDRRLRHRSGRHQLPALPVPLDDPGAGGRADGRAVAAGDRGRSATTAPRSTSSTSGTRSSDALTLLEINPRHSQSHAELFAWVDGVANHHHMVRAGAGPGPAAAAPARARTPWPPSGSCDARPTAWSAGCPTADEIARVERGRRRLRRRGDGRAGRAPLGAARPGQLQLRDRERLRGRGERGRAGAQVRAGGGRAAVRDRRRRTETVRGTRLHEDRRPLPARGRRGHRLCIPHVGRDAPRRAGLAAGDSDERPCRPSWSSSRTASAT